MRICFVSHASNYHTKKWAEWFYSHGHEVHVISFAYSEIPNVSVHTLSSNVEANASDVKKLGYLTHGRKLRWIISEIGPDIINIHYASSYGALAAISGIDDYILSIWGSDVYEFPEKSILHRGLLKFSLARASVLFSTSKAMAKQASKYTKKPFYITPFGVDMELFSPQKRVRETSEKDLIIGTVKALKPKYGIEHLIRAVALTRKEHPEIPIKLRIAGKGEYEKVYKALATDLGIEDITTWLGFISQDDVALEWANMDIAVIPSESESESFGVSAVEAQACGTPVIISDIPGLMEATDPGNSSIVVPRGNEREIANQIIDLYKNPKKRHLIGKRGRIFVEERFEIDRCFRDIERKYLEIVKKRDI